MRRRFSTFDERPELPGRAGHLRAAWPPLMPESPISNERWHLLYDRFGGFQFWLVDEDTDVCSPRASRCRRDSTRLALPDRGWEHVMEHATNGDEEPTLVSAIQVLVDPALQGGGLSALMLAEMRKIAGAAGFRDLVAPVRPSLKARYPLTPIARYVSWTTADGLPFDPWLRVYARARGEHPRGSARLDGHLRARSPTGSLGRACASPRVALRVPRGAAAGRDGRRGRPGRLRRAERLDAPADRLSLPGAAPARRSRGSAVGASAAVAVAVPARRRHERGHPTVGSVPRGGLVPPGAVGVVAAGGRRGRRSGGGAVEASPPPRRLLYGRLRQADGAVGGHDHEAVPRSASTASPSSSPRRRAAAATPRSVSARRCRNEPSKRPCLRSGSSRVPREGQLPRAGRRRSAGCGRGRPWRRDPSAPGPQRRRTRGRPSLDPLDVDVARQYVLAEGEVPHRGRGVRPDAGQRGQVVRPALAGDDRGRRCSASARRL